MATKTLTHQELDTKLDAFAADQEGFAEACAAYAAGLDRRGVQLEILEEGAWRRPAASGRSRASFLEQLRSDVERTDILDREDEARLARRVEFARIRLEGARRKAGFDGDDPLDGLGRLAEEWNASRREVPKTPHERVIRASELHALRVEMVERNLYLVLINVERYAHSAVNRADLVQEGAAALFRAVDGFDWRRGLLFRTYAVHWLNQAFRNYLYNFSHTVRVPVYLQKALKQIHQAQIKLGDTNASAERIAEITDLSEHLVSSAIGASKSSYSLDADLGGDDDGNRLRDLLVVEEEDGPYSTSLEEITLEDGLARALERLSDRERLVVLKRFGLGGEQEHTLAEVAEILGVSVERVRQIQVRALSKLDTPHLRRELDPYLN
ncbi:MAG: sigma-70 family RNA polymerase sigma factor [Planctomycetota bacterium]